MKRLIRYIIVGLTVLSTLAGGAVAGNLIQVAAAGSGSGVGDGLHAVKITLDNGRVNFDTCKGTCSAMDIDPNTAGPIRPWQTKGNKRETKGQTMILLGKGIKTSLVDSSGKAQIYTGLGTAVCFNYTDADVAAAGGKNSLLRVAYWDPGITDWDGWVPTTGRWYALKTTYTAGKKEACGLLRLTATFALVAVEAGN